MKRIGYIRVSTKEQELGLEAQTQQLIDYGVAKGDIFVDKGTSGTVNTRSEKMGKLMAFVEAHDGQVEVVVSKLDRWGRDPEDTIAKIKELDKIGGCLTSLAESVLRATPENAAGMLLIRILLAVAAMERERIAERTRDALEALRKRGVPLGPTPKLVPGCGVDQRAPRGLRMGSAAHRQDAPDRAQCRGEQVHGDEGARHG